MNRKDWKLLPEEMHEIKDWLKRTTSHRSHRCPFSGEEACLEICQVMFPKTAKEWGCRDFNECPCDVYSPSYVVRKARLVLARGGRLHRERKESKEVA